ncbi:hypothetical protein [Alteromonas sp. CYL-A6]|uniref:hypothetical protein n=1 Tax=Alteromonas nitratireducens TaxID=3390813 RepID=UPI0034B24C6B
MSGNYKAYFNVTVIGVFVAVMVTLIIQFNSSEPNINDALLKQMGQRFQSSATTAYWQWKAEGQPDMIMLVHYNNKGKEVARTPVRMTAPGIPLVTPTSDGCDDLWSALMSVPMDIDGFRIHGEFYGGSADARKPDDSYCRFRLSRGTYFDYYIYERRVEHEDGA